MAENEWYGQINLDRYCDLVPKKEWRFSVTGTDVNGRRNKPVNTSNFAHAKGQNFYNGTFWGVWPNGQRTLLWEIWN